jgi:hypothetical protein
MVPHVNFGKEIFIDNVLVSFSEKYGVYILLMEIWV